MSAPATPPAAAPAPALMSAAASGPTARIGPITGITPNDTASDPRAIAPAPATAPTAAPSAAFVSPAPSVLTVFPLAFLPTTPIWSSRYPARFRSRTARSAASRVANTPTVVSCTDAVAIFASRQGEWVCRQ